MEITFNTLDELNIPKVNSLLLFPLENFSNLCITYGILCDKIKPVLTAQILQS